jgi:hypothetical protein
MIDMTPSDLINFIEHNKFIATSLRVECNVVSLIRSRLRFIYSDLFDGDKDSSVAARLRLELFKLQSSPKQPSVEILSECSLEENKRVLRLFGDNIANACSELEELFQSIEGIQSPLLSALINTVENEMLTHDSSQIKIWCHKNEKVFFVHSFLVKGIALKDYNFIHSLSEYKRLRSFDCLVRIGPLRNFGWCKTPNIILTAPRYKKFVRFIWSGMADEPGYTSDILMGAKQRASLFIYQEHQVEANIEFKFSNKSVEALSIGETEIDDINFLMQRPLPVQKETTAVLVELSNEVGVLLRPGAKKLVFNGESEGSIVIKPITELDTGQYLISHNIQTDLGNEQIELEKTTFAKLWKRRLKKEFDTDQKVLILKMLSAGIELKHLEGAVKRWIRMEGQVITGPQTREHFKLLIESVLAGCLDPQKWHRAWKEIQDSNVKAMQNGMLENELTNSQLISDLGPHLAEIRQKAGYQEEFELVLPDTVCLSGKIKFSQVLSVSVGFKCPNEKLNTFEHIAELEIYRNTVKDLE